MKCFKHIAAVLSFIMLSDVGSAQQSNPSFTVSFPKNVVLEPRYFPTQLFFSDTTKKSDTLQSVVVRKSSDSTPSRKGYNSTKSAGLAVGLSAVLPGAGQIYNESYWKAPVIWGLTTYWVYEWIDLNGKYKDFRDQFQKSVETFPPYGDTQKQRVRDFYRDERDKFAWYLGALYFVNLLDAYITANLYDFNVSPDLGADGTVAPRLTASIRLRF